MASDVVAEFSDAQPKCNRQVRMDFVSRLEAINAPIRDPRRHDAVKPLMQFIDKMKFVQFLLFLCIASISDAFILTSNRSTIDWSTTTAPTTTDASSHGRRQRQRHFQPTAAVVTTTTTLLRAKISRERRDQLGIGDDQDEYDLDVALEQNTDPLITKIIAGSLIVAILAGLVFGVVIPATTDYGDGLCNPLLSAGRC